MSNDTYSYAGLAEFLDPGAEQSYLRLSHFLGGSSELRHEHIDALEMMVEGLRRAFGVNWPDTIFQVTGFASPDGDPEYNQALSEARAQTVAAFLDAAAAGIATEFGPIAARAHGHGEATDVSDESEYPFWRLVLVGFYDRQIDMSEDDGLTITAVPATGLATLAEKYYAGADVGLDPTSACVLGQLLVGNASDGWGVRPSGAWDLYYTADGVRDLWRNSARANGRGGSSTNHPDFPNTVHMADAFREDVEQGASEDDLVSNLNSQTREMVKGIEVAYQLAAGIGDQVAGAIAEINPVTGGRPDWVDEFKERFDSYLTQGVYSCWR